MGYNGKVQMTRRWKGKFCCKGENWRRQQRLLRWCRKTCCSKAGQRSCVVECGVRSYLSDRCQKLPLQFWRSVVQVYRLSMGSVKVAEALVVWISSAKI